MRQKRQLVIYSMGADGSDVLFRTLAKTPDVKVRRVQTLSWKKIAATRMLHAGGRWLNPVRTSEKIMREEWTGATPLYFITLAADPFASHIRRSFHRLYHAAIPANDMALAMYDASHAQSWFEKIDPAHSAQWFACDYEQVTGISLRNKPLQEYNSFTVGKHQFLILSETLPFERQCEIIAEFIGHPVSAGSSEKTEVVQDYLIKQYGRLLIEQNKSAFYDTPWMEDLYSASEREKMTASWMEKSSLPASIIHNKKDRAIVNALATYTRRDGHIIKPLTLWRALKSPTPRHGLHIENLQSQRDAMVSGISLTPRKAPVYAPKPKTVLYTPHQSRPYHHSGYASRTHAITGALHRQGWDMHVYTRAGYPADTGIKDTITAQALIDDRLYHFDTRTQSGKDDMPLDRYIDQSAAYLCEAAKKINARLIHGASNYLCGLPAIEAARRLGIPCIYEMRGLWHITRWAKDPDYHQCDQFALSQALEMQCAREADHILAITDALKQWLVDQGIESHKISVAPNAVDTDRFTPLPYDTEYAASLGVTDKIVIGYIGSFVSYEGLDLLLEAVARLPKDIQNRIKIVWAGDGPMLEPWLKLADTLNIRHLLLSLGRIPFEAVPRLYSIIDIAPFPRSGEMVCEIISPLKPFEAMAMEKTVIASSVRPLAEIINHGETGLIHKKDNAQDLSDKLLDLISDQSLRQSCARKAREWVCRSRRWDLTAKTITGVYDRVAP
jgi:glycosyltransferase involved in cell wall biosynthesis